MSKKLSFKNFCKEFSEILQINSYNALKSKKICHMCKQYFLHIINHFPQCEKLGCALLIILLYISTLAILFSIESGLFKNIENFKNGI